MVNMYNKMVWALNIALGILSFIVSPAIMLAGWLMSPDWTSGDLFKIRPILHDLWVLVSNITYFIYALLLIFIALATIFNSQNYGYKKLLPRLALGIVLVPLTWWFVQFIISLSTIVTASVMNMPTDVMDKYFTANSSPDTWWNTDSIPTEYQFYTDPAVLVAWAETQYANNSTLTSPKKILTDASGIYGSLLIYGNGLFKFNEIKKLSTTTDVMKSIWWLINKGILGVVMFIVFWFLVIALIFMLMMRAIKLWFYAIFSPLLTLRYVIGDGIFGGKEGADSFELKEFIWLAFVPALVGLALSFGIVIIALLQSANIGSNNLPCDAAAMQPGGAGCQIMGIMGSPNNHITKKVEIRSMEDGDYNITVTEVVFGGISFKYYGSYITDVNEYAASASAYSSALSVTGSVFGTLIIDIIALIFLWAWFMAAKNVSKVAKAAFAPFESIGNKFGKMAMEIPKYTPIPGTGWWSLKAAEKTIDLQESRIRQQWEENSDVVIWKAFPHLMKWVIKPAELAKLDEAVRSNNASTSEGMKKILETRARVEASWDQNKVNYSSVGERSAEVFKSNKAVLDKELSKSGILGHDAEIVAKYLQKEQLSDAERAKAYQIIQQKFNGSGTSWASWTTTASWFSAGRITGSDSVNITLNWWVPITIKNEAWKDTITFSPDEFKKQLEWKTAIVDRDTFVKSLMATNAMTAKAAEAVAKEIENINANYFSNSATPKKPDAGTPTPPPAWGQAAKPTSTDSLETP